MGIGAGIAALTGIAAGWGIAVDIAIGVGLGAWGAYEAKKMADKLRDSQERKQILRSSAASKNWVYGKNRSSGLLIFAQEQDGSQSDGEAINIVLALAGHELTSIEDIQFDNVPIDEFTSDVTSYIAYKRYPQGATEVDQHLLSECPSWTEKMIGRGFGWCRFRLVYNSSVFPSGLPNISMVKRGKRVEDIRTGVETWSDNPALILLDYMRSKGWEDEMFLMDTFKEAANICDEMVVVPDGSTTSTARVPEYGLMTPDSENYVETYWVLKPSDPDFPDGPQHWHLYYKIVEGGATVYEEDVGDNTSQSNVTPIEVANGYTYYPQEYWTYKSGGEYEKITRARWYKTRDIDPISKMERRYTLGCEFDDEEQQSSVIDKMLNACGGMLIKRGGQVGLIVGAYYGPAMIEITDDDIIGDSVEIQPEIDRASSFNIARGTYIEPDQNYTEVDYPEVRVEEWVTDDEEEIVMDLSFDYVQSPWQAQRLADIAMKKSRLGMTFSIKCNLRATECAPGTMVNLSISSLGFLTQEFKVLEQENSPDEGITLKLQLDSPDFYDDAVGEPIEIPPLIDLPTGGVPAPENLKFTPQVVGDVVQGIITWKNKLYQLDRTDISIKDESGILIHSESVPFPGEQLPVTGKVAGTYTVEAVSVGVNGSQSLPSVMTITIDVPKMPTAVGMYPSNNGMEIRPNYGTADMPVATLFEFFRTTKADYDANNYPTGNPRARGYIWTDTGLIPDTQYYYFIRAANPYGVSPFTKATETTTSNPDQQLPPPEGSIDWGHLDDDMQDLIDGIIQDADETESAVNGIGDDLVHVTEEFNIYKTENDAALASMTNDIAAGDSHVLEESTAYTDAEGNKLAEKIDEVSTGLSSVQEDMSAVEDELGNQQAYWQIAATADDVTASIAVVASSTTGRGQVIATADDFIITNTPGGEITEQPFVFQDGSLFLNSAIIKELTAINIYASYIADSRSDPKFEIDGAKGIIKGAQMTAAHITSSTIDIQADEGSNVGMKLTNENLTVYDEHGKLKVRIGKLS